MKTIFEQSVSGRAGVLLPESDNLSLRELPDKYKRSNPAQLPELSELDVVRHFTSLAVLNFSLDGNFYPLGSCTMKYNFKVLEKASSFNEFLNLHPFITNIDGGAEAASGALELIFKLQEFLCDITAMDAGTTQPLAGAHGEFTGMLIIKAYHDKKHNNKKYVIVPDESHGTNPASAAMAGYEIITVPTAANGLMDIASFKAAVNDEVAAVIMTCPNTLGIFSDEINEISEIAHSVDALMYYDGANLNAILAKVRPGDLGFDVVHVNVHKTFGTPHGGGGPGAGPVCVKGKLKKFLPHPIVISSSSNEYALLDPNEESIGKVAPFFGNFAVLIKAYAYIYMMGSDGLNDVSDKAVLNANYMMAKLKDYYELPYDRSCMHEFVLSASKQAKKGVHAIDIAKYLIDQGYHPPTVYFPLIVKEAIMIEPTESESKDTIDAFIMTMQNAAKLAEEDPESFKALPISRNIGRLDEVAAARDLNVNFQE